MSLLIIQGSDFVSGIEEVYRRIKGSCTMLLLTEDGLIAARDSWGRTPLVLGRKDGAYAVASETTSFANLGYEVDYFLGPGEIVKVGADGFTQLRKPNRKMQMSTRRVVKEVINVRQSVLLSDSLKRVKTSRLEPA